MAMPRPQGKAFKIAKQVVPGLRSDNKDVAPQPKARAMADVETLKMETNINQGRLPRKYR